MWSLSESGLSATGCPQLSQATGLSMRSVASRMLSIQVVVFLTLSGALQPGLAQGWNLHGHTGLAGWAGSAWLGSASWISGLALSTGAVVLRSNVKGAVCYNLRAGGQGLGH